MFKIRLLLGVSFLLSLVVLVPAQAPLFSTGTGYDLSFDRTLLNQRTLGWQELARVTGSDVPEGMENCSPVGSYIVYREGTSFPDQMDVEALHNFQDKMRSQPVNVAYQFLNRIPRSRIPLFSADSLTEVGRREMQELASRIKTRFREFFRNEDVDLTRFDFQSTNSTKSIDSAIAFARGLVGLNQICETLSSEGNVTVVCTENIRQSRVLTPTSAYIPYEPANMDAILRPDNTKRECLDTTNMGRTMQELNNYRNGRENMQLHNRIAKKLSASANQLWNISRDEVQLLAKICGYHLAMFNDNSTWCALFDYEDLNVAEYQRELQHYWDESYGFPLNSRVACPLINDTLHYFTRITAARTGVAASLPLMALRFTDANTLIRLASLLGINRDPQQLTAANYLQSRNRQFRSAKMAPFAGNIALNLYNCQGQGMFFNDQTYRVQVLMNEQPVNITFCQDTFCDLADFRRELLNQAGHCMVDKECNVAMGLNPDGSRPTPPRGGGPRPGNGGPSGHSPVFIMTATLALIVAKIGYNGL